MIIFIVKRSGGAAPLQLVSESQNVLITLLEDLVNSHQGSLIFHSQVVFVLFIHRLDQQDHDLVGLFVSGHQDQIFVAFVLDNIQVLKSGFNTVLVGEGQDVLLLVQDLVVVFHG